MKPAGRRAAVRHLQQHFAVSERRACRLIGFQRSSLRYHHQKRDDGRLRARLRDLAAARPRFGYRRLRVLLRREGHPVNHTDELRCQENAVKGAEPGTVP